MINVTKTYIPDLEKYQSYVENIFKSGWLTNNGQYVQELEKRLKEYLGVKNIVLVSNGTLALQVAYKVLGLKGDVITTPFSFVATVSSQVWEGLNPVFVDINPRTYNIDSSKIEEAITSDTSAIVPVHVFGNCCEVELIEQIAKRHNLKVIYDAAHAFAVKYKGNSILNYGDISILSFHSTKVFHTIEGGALIINDDDLYEKARLMINFGIPGPDRIIELGINAKMNEFEAAMGLCVLEDVDKNILKRKTLYEHYCANLPRTISTQEYSKDCTHNYGYMPVIFNNEKELLAVKERLEQNGIYPRRYFYPSLDTLSYIEKKRNMPIANDLTERILCLPIYDSLEIALIDKIIEIINECIN